MNRTLKRPMFRMGGSTGTGITSGLDQPRKQYSQGTDPYDRALSTTERAMKDLEKFRGEQGSFSPMAGPGFLTSFGLDLMSRPSRGSGLTGFLATAADSAKNPFKTFQAAKMAERNRKGSAAEDLFTGALASEYDLEEQRIKNLAEGDDNRKTAEVEMQIIKDAQDNIFKQRDILNSGTATIDEKKAAERIIKSNQNVLIKELGVTPEYSAIISNEDLFDNAMEGYVSAENKKRIKDYQRDNPEATDKDIQQNVVLVQEGTQEAYDITFARLKERYGYEDGGRVGLAFGGEPMMEEVAENPDQVEDLSYTQLRSRLPQEISNDIVQLLANSKQALMDFANIQTGEDIASFNQQYDVNLTLPQGA